MKKALRMFLLAGVAASLAVTVPLAACETTKGPCKDGEHVDADGDGICDNCENPMPDPNACPNGGTHIDSNNDGKCDKCGGDYSGGTIVTPPTDYKYTVTVSSIGGMPLKEVYVTLVGVNGKNLNASTNDKGVAGFNVDPAAYTVTLSNVPKGYKYDESYTSSGADKNFDIHLESSVILENAPQGTRYRVGDVLYDFTYTVDGETYQLSKLLETNRAVFLNFWATWCGPCKSEFPYVNASYISWKNKVETDPAYAERGIEMLAISSYDGQSVVSQFKASNNYQFPMMTDSVGITSMVAYSGGIPTTVVIDRYGVCAEIHTGSITNEAEWNAKYDKYTSDEYFAPDVDPDPDPNPDPIPERVKPDIPWPSFDDIADAATADESEFNFYKDDDEYAWPWVISEDGNSIYPSNTTHPYSYATIYFDVTLTQEDIDNGNTIVAFDFHAETEQGYDMLFIVTDEKFVRTISGVSETDWEICYAHAFDTPGTHQIALLYQKNTSIDVGSDRVEIKNIRVVNENDQLDHEFYVQRNVATGARDTTNNTYEKYESVVFNSKESGGDGYYHVGNKNGPLLLANLIGRTQYDNDSSFWNYVYLGQLLLDLDGDGEAEDYTEQGTYFANRASDSDIENCFPVTELLRTYLQGLAEKQAKASGKPVNPKAWLEFCCYYQPYGTEEQLPDPIIAMTTHSAIELVMDDSDTNEIEGNQIDVYKRLNPRGHYYYFIPEVSGAYNFSSYGDRYFYNADRVLEKVTDATGMETTGEIEKDNGNFFEAESILGANDFNAQGDDNNFSLTVYLEAGQKYYLRTMFDSSEMIGTYFVKITYVAEETDVWYHASTGFYTTTVDENGEPTSTLYLPSIEYIYDAQEDRFYNKLENGEKGGMIYIDFVKTSYFTSDMSLDGWVDVTRAVHAINQDGSTEVAPTFDFYTWGSFPIEDFENDGKIKTIEGEDYTDIMKAYRDQALENYDNWTGDPNLRGCIPATAELVNILQVYTNFYGIGTFMPNNWLMLAYYYEHIGPTE